MAAGIYTGGEADGSGRKVMGQTFRKKIGGMLNDVVSNADVEFGCPNAACKRESE